jgi:hypothetical protein
MWMLWTLILAAQDPLDDARRALREGRLAHAEGFLLETIRVRTDDAQAWFLLGHVRLRRGAYEDALSPLDMAAELGLDDFQVHYQRGYCAHRLGRHAEAERSLRRALAHRPGDVDARFHLAVSLHGLGRHAEAALALDGLIEPNGRWTHLARLYRGLCRMELGLLDAAGADLLRVAEEAEQALAVKARQALASMKAAPQPEGRQEVPFPEPEPAAPSTRVTALLLAKAGWDSNVLRMPGSSVAVGSAESDFFLISMFSGSFEALPQRLLALRLGAIAVEYIEQRESSVRLGFAALETELPLAEGLALLASAKYEEFQLELDPYFDRASGGASMRADLGSSTSLRAGFRLARKEHELAANAGLDATERELFAELEEEELLSWLGVSLRVQLHDEEAEAPDRRYRDRLAGARVEARASAGLRLRVEAWRRLRDFAEPDAGFGVAREDTNDGVRAGLHFGSGGGSRFFVEFERERSDSNIDAFDYDRVAWTLGFTLLF